MIDIFQLIKDKRIHLLQSEYPEYDASAHLIKVMQYAAQHNCLDSLTNAFGRLAPDGDSDAIIIMSPEDPYNFFWFRLSREEYEATIKVAPRYQRPEFRAHGKYCGGLIGHIVYKDGEQTMQRDWSVHT